MTVISHIYLSYYNPMLKVYYVKNYSTFVPCCVCFCKYACVVQNF